VVVVVGLQSRQAAATAPETTFTPATEQQAMQGRRNETEQCTALFALLPSPPLSSFLFLFLFLRLLESPSGLLTVL